jgi:hypothetical protein
VAVLKSQRVNIIAGVFTFYLVATAWLTVKRKEQETGLLERGLLLVGSAAGAGSLIFAWQAAHWATGRGGGAAAAHVVFGMAALLAASGDGRMLVRGGVSGARRLVRHLWRMCVALFIAAASFFIGTSSDPVFRQSGLRARLFPAAIRHTHLPEVPLIIIAVLTIFWLFRVRASRHPRPTGASSREARRSDPSAVPRSS